MTDLHGHWLRLIDSAYSLLDFMAAGGAVMWALAALCVLYWTLVFERLWFMRCSRIGSNPGAKPGRNSETRPATGSVRSVVPGWPRRSSNLQAPCG